jgi:hypothetical protein
LRKTLKIAILILGVVRFLELLVLPLPTLIGFGDLGNFFNLAQIPGWPYFDFWSEYPPVFPFISKLIYGVAGGRDAPYVHLLFFILTLLDMLNLFLFSRIAEKISPESTQKFQVGAYLVVLAIVPYSGWYFEPLVVTMILAALLWMVEGKHLRAGWMIGFGILTKMFPALLLPAAMKQFGWKRGLVTAGVALGLVVATYGSVWLASPDFTRASLQSQGAKGSWETVWALLDGNEDTGRLGPLVERLEPAMAVISRHQPAVIPPWVTLLVFGTIGMAAFIKFKPQNNLQVVSFTLLTFSLFFLWSPGWSPQWVLYFLPLIFLALPPRKALLMALSLIIINLVEWPLIFSQGKTQFLPLTVGVRTGLLILLTWISGQVSFGWFTGGFLYTSGRRSEKTGI